MLTTSGAGVHVKELGSGNRLLNQVTYDLSIDSLAPGWQFDGFGVRQGPPADNSDVAPLLANPRYTVSSPDVPFGTLGTVSDINVNYFTNYANNQIFGSEATLNANRDLGPNRYNAANPAATRDYSSISRANARHWSLSLVPEATTFSLTYATGFAGTRDRDAEVNGESVYFFASASRVSSVPEPSSVALITGVVLVWTIRRRAKKGNGRSSTR
ncbi:PEP-CTERM sorting domain-containing protein [Allorhodopirellula solitaria]|nr:PEP-CTERM sorting domain-containing protein [Allorhodopirellula solitaria]